MNLDPTHLSTARHALLFVRRTLLARNEPTAAFDNALAGIEAALTAQNYSRVNTLTPRTTANGNHETAVSHTEFDDWITVDEAAQLLDCSVRRVRQLAPAIGAVKRGGCWWIPRSALPDEED